MKKLVVRSAYGISYYPTGAQGGGNAKPSGLGFTANPAFFSGDSGLTPGFIWDNGFPQNYTRPPVINPGFGVVSGSPISVPFWDPNAKEPTNRQDWNLGIQYQLADNWLLDASYVGSKSTRLATGVVNYNQVDSRYLSLGELLNRNIADPAVTAAGFTRPYPSFNGSLAQSLRPFPQYSGLNATNSANFGNMTYNSLQMKVEKQFSQGLFFLSSFTWSKTLTDASSALSGFFSTSARDNYNRKLEKGLAQFDVPARLVVAFNYELPIGPGKPAAGGSTGAAAKILGGWQVNGIMLRNPLSPKTPHFAPKAKRVILLWMQGGPSQMDLFDYKPRLKSEAGNQVPFKLNSSDVRFEKSARLMKKSGNWLAQALQNSRIRRPPLRC